MKLVEDQLAYETSYIIINGNGIYPDFSILKRICEVYNGLDRIIIFPRTGLKRLQGLSALQHIGSHLDNGYRNLIFIVDREHIKENAISEIKSQLIGINILNELQIGDDAFIFECRKGHRNFRLFCNISGLTNCIEEELLKLIELQQEIQINIASANTDASWRAQLKAEIKRHANKKEVKKLLKRTGQRKLEIAFPNLCAIFEEIERNYGN